jgi:predicted nucleotidyltransferase
MASQRAQLSGGVEEAEAVLADAVSAYCEALGERLVGAYALGSLAHGGFSFLVSDVDLGLVLADPLRCSDPETVQQLADVLKARGSVLHERLSVFWGTPSTLGGQQVGGRFPPLDRLDLLQHGRLLIGEDTREDLPRPSRADLLVTGAEFALEFLAGIGPTRGPRDQGVGSLNPAGEDAVEQIRRPEVLVARGIRRVTKLVLFPVRFLYTAETGLVGTNHSATDQYLAADQAPAASLVAAALTWRTAPPDGAEATTLLRKEMIPLYLHYIDDHTARLQAVGRLDLAEAFTEWRNRIVA